LFSNSTVNFMLIVSKLKKKIYIKFKIFSQTYINLDISGITFRFNSVGNLISENTIPLTLLKL